MKPVNEEMCIVTGGRSVDVRESTVFQAAVPVKYDVDVMVAGGGPSGLAAAISAARQGMKVYLAEGQSVFGGMGTMGMLPMFCPFTDGVNFLVGGIGREVLEKCIEWGIDGPDPLRGLDEKLYSYVTFHPEHLKRLYDQLVVETGMSFSFHTQVMGVEKESESRVSLVFCHAKSGIFAVRAKVFIDCTGDGDLAVMSGAQYDKGDGEGNLMPGTLCSLWAGIDWGKEPVKSWEDGRYLAQAFKDGIFSVEDPGLPGMFRIGDTLGGGNMGHAFGVDSTDEVSLTRALIEQRKRMVEYGNYYKKYLPGYGNAELAATAPLLGVRESRRITGDYVLNVNDFIRRAVFEDEIGRYAYGVDIHPSKPGMDAHVKCQEDIGKLKYARGESYGIPYRTLTPKGLSNVLTAGRCTSCDRHMLGSVRVMPGCFITGQAAGIAAAIAVENRTDTRGVEIGELQKRLKQQGAFLPNYQDRSVPV